MNGAAALAGWKWQIAQPTKLEAENGKLKKLLAEAHLDIEVLKSVVRGKR
jgi:hypothetical protein